MPQIISRTTRHDQLTDIGAITNPHTAPDIAAGVVGQELVTDTTLTATAQQIDITSVDLEAEGVYLVLLTWKQTALAGTSSCSLYYNSDTTATNYYTQKFLANHTTISGARGNDAILGQCDQNHDTVFVIWIGKAVGEEAQASCYAHQGLAPASIQLTVKLHKWTSSNNVTTISLKTGGADEFGIGTRIQVFRQA